MMDRFPHVLLSLAITVIISNGPGLAAEPSAPSPRIVQEVSQGWRFQIDAHDQGEKGRWFDVKHDRSAWKEVEVPRAWDTYDESLRGYEGAGWYSVSIPGSWNRSGMRQILSFGRVMYHTKVWLNGEFLGEHIDGYLPFSFDVTGKLSGAVNQLTLRVDNRPRIDLLPAAKEIEWVQYGGILQPVRVESRSRTAIANLAIQAKPAGTGAGAAVTSIVEVESDEALSDLILRISVPGRERTLAIKTDPRQVSRRQIALTMGHAEPWSPAAPVIYNLTASLEREGRVLDSVQATFGVRSIEARGGELLLNGRPIRIQGVNRYDEYGEFGPNPPWELVERDLRWMKQAGVNLIRTHYPQSPELLALCDRLGILFLEELPINWWGVEWFGKEGVAQKETILDQALPMLDTLVRRDRNHPSVIIWSMCNESRTDTDIGIKVMRRLIARTKELDPSRLVTFVTAPGSVSAHRAYEDADLVATNLYPGSLAPPLADSFSQFEDLVRKPAEEALRRESAAFPGKPLLITEFGAKGFHGTHGGAPLTEDFQARYISTIWNVIAGNHDVAGGVLWSWADYYHRPHFQPFGVFGPYGVVTVDRRPKAALKALSQAYGGTIDK